MKIKVILVKYFYRSRAFFIQYDFISLQKYVYKYFILQMCDSFH
jgi:hypothetical protein